MTDQLDIRVASVAEIPGESALHRWELLRYTGQPIDVALTASFSTESHRRPAIALRVRYTAMRGRLRRPLLSYAMRMEFDVDGIESRTLATPTAFYVTPELLRLMLGLAIGAMRGMLALRTAGTVLAQQPLPVFSIDELLHNIMGADRRYRHEHPVIHLPA